MTILRSLLFAMLIAAFIPMHAQNGEGGEKEKPDQLDMIKINVTQLAVNEARLFYEIELRKASSLELGLGYIYPNPTWFEQGERPMLATGAAVYASYRKYMDKKRYIYQPYLRSYLSPMLFYRYSSFQNEWLLFPSADPQFTECEQFSENIQQLGFVMRFGWINRAGRFVFDFYSGLGFKYQPSKLTSHLLNSGTEQCEPLSTSVVTESSITLQPVNVILNAGVKIGLRRSNRERDYPDPFQGSEEINQEGTPPQF